MLSLINQKTFEFVYGLAHHFRALDWLGIFFASYLPYAVGVALLVILFYPSKKKKEHTWMVFLSLLSGLFARYVVKGFILALYQEPRPFIQFPSVHPLIQVAASENLQSFPSGHALFFFALAMMVYLFHKRAGKWFILAASLIAIARVYVGVHYPFDVIVGALLGMLTSYCIYRLYKVCSKTA